MGKLFFALKQAFRLSSLLLILPFLHCIFLYALLNNVNFFIYELFVVIDLFLLFFSGFTVAFMIYQKKVSIWTAFILSLLLVFCSDFFHVVSPTMWFFGIKLY